MENLEIKFDDRPMEQENKLEDGLCSLCGKHYGVKKNLFAHMRRFHNVEPGMSKNIERKFECEYCGTKFSKKSSLVTHVGNFHAHEATIADSSRKSRLICPVDNCDVDFKTYLLLRQHLSAQHNQDIEYEELAFECLEQFESWKMNMQQVTLSSYTNDTGMKSLANGDKKQYYNCHRSYNYIYRGGKKGMVKVLGTNKINKACPSRIEITVNANTGIVQCVFYKTHCGHNTQIGRLCSRSETAAPLKCKFCSKEATGFLYRCMVCIDYEFCGECEGRGTDLHHDNHYVLRVPAQRPMEEVEQVELAVRQTLASFPTWHQKSTNSTPRRKRPKGMIAPTPGTSTNIGIMPAAFQQSQPWIQPSQVENDFPKKWNEPETIWQESDKIWQIPVTVKQEAAVPTVNPLMKMEIEIKQEVMEPPECEASGRDLDLNTFKGHFEDDPLSKERRDDLEHSSRAKDSLIHIKLEPTTEMDNHESTACSERVATYSETGHQLDIWCSNEDPS